MLTPAAVKARAQLSDHPSVVAGVDRLWCLATRHGETAVSRQHFSVCIQLALDVDGDFNVFKAEKVAASDWLEDTPRAGGADASMQHAAFHATIFELVDLWTADISASSYAAFLLQRDHELCIKHKELCIKNKDYCI